MAASPTRWARALLLRRRGALGQDRTGTVVAAYRISRQGWTYDEAMQEMQAFGFNDIWVHLKSFLKDYANKRTK